MYLWGGEMNHTIWTTLKQSRDDARALLNRLDFLVREAACKNCGGSGYVPLSREPCSTSETECPTCDGEGWVK